MRPVLVTTLHEDETSLAHSSMKVESAGDGLVKGLASDEDVAKMEAAGLLVELLPTTMDVVAAGFIPPPSGLETYVGELPKAPVTVEIAASGPIQPEWLADLQQAGIERLERSGGDRLTMHVADDSTLEEIAALEWVLGVREKPRLPAAAHPSTADAAWDIRLETEAEKQAVIDWANAKGFTVLGSSSRRVRVSGRADQEDLLSQLELEVTPYVEPELHNDCARLDVGCPAAVDLLVGHSTVQLTGEGEVVAVADSGLDDTHTDFDGRVLKLIARGRAGDTTDIHGHGTHVAGTILGSGAASQGTYQGIAPKAKLVFQSVMDATFRLTGLPVDLNEMFEQAYAEGARVHNNSWGSAVQSRYVGSSEDVDEFVAKNPDMLIVISAGNHGTTNIDEHIAHPLERGRVQPLSLGAPATSKNALVVGAARSSRVNGGLSETTYAQSFPQRFGAPQGPADVGGERVSGNREQLAGFSGRGPCDDRRLKPDVVAPGTDIISARSATAPEGNFWGLVPNQPYGYMGGTSMSAPVVSGLAALVREYYVRHRNVPSPSAALLKATIINGTRQLTGGDAGGPIPNPHQGFGCVHLPTTLPLAPDKKLAFVDVAASQGLVRVKDRRRYSVTTTASDELRVCLVFTDPAARALQNDLDLVVEAPGFPRKKFLGNEALVGSLTREDRENNVEIVRVPAAAAGRWTIAVLCRNLMRAPQGFALVVLGALQDDVLQPDP